MHHSFVTTPTDLAEGGGIAGQVCNAFTLTLSTQCWDFKEFDTVSHFSYAPLCKGPHFFTKMLESNILYDNLLIVILSV